MLRSECADSHVILQLHTTIHSISRNESGGYAIVTNQGDYACESLVIATGGKSIPKMALPILVIVLLSNLA